MSEANSFDVLKRMADAEAGSEVIAMFPVSNLKSAKTGKGGWGTVTMAVNNDTVVSLLSRDKVVVMLVYSISEFRKTKAELESSPCQE